MVDIIQQVSVKFNYNSKQFIISMVYARCSVLVRLELWEELHRLGSSCDTPWII